MGCIACLEKDDRYPHTCNKGANITLGEIRAMDPRTPHLTNLELTPTYDQPPTKSHSGDHMCNCERDYDTSDGHALDCTIRGVNATVNTIEGVAKPSHYMLFDDIEAIEVIARSMTREQFKGYCLGNILKYRLRAGKKSELAFLEKDMAKAGFYGELYEKHKDKCYA